MDLTPERFEELVADALDGIPEELAARIDNVAVVVEDWPSPEQLASVELEPGDVLFGLYQGVDLVHRSPLQYAGVMPDRIVIFMGPHLRRARTVDEVAERVRVTVVHEIAHHFGIDDDRLDELGWG